ncbi:MAG: ABC transporter ATP-binding protein [Candidatus Aminicenantales bacterium]|jgi:ABC-2 type transport system ATP-binding protein
MTAAITVNDLRKTYGPLTAVDGVGFEVGPGEIFGMVGPNGAGKTTTIECLEGMRSPDAGDIRILGLDPRRDGYELRERIGVQLQQSSLPDDIKVWEALDLFASYYRKPAPWEPLLDELGIADKREARFSKLSGGQKQRLFIALALVNDPEVVFLDELTTGLDPHARRAMWKLVRAIRDRGKTVFLTTHYMEEAEHLCNRVLIIDRGRIVALDTPEKLVANLKAETRIVFTAAEPDYDPAPLRAVAGVTRVDVAGDKVTVTGRGDRLVILVVNALDAQQARFRDLRTEQPSLDDVFMAMTGDEMKPDGGAK